MVTGSSSTTKRCARALFIGFISLKDGEGYKKRAPFSHATFNVYLAGVFFDDPFADRQPQSGTLPHPFCREEGLEDSLFRFFSNSNSRIGYRDFQPSSLP